MRGLHKMCHRLLLDAITHPPPLIAVVLTVFLSVFAIGFWCAHWIDQVDLAAYRTLNVFTDNIKGENLLNQISSGLPIDVVYTWVNGSDPELLLGLQKLSQINPKESCPLSHCLPAPYVSFLNNQHIKNPVTEVLSQLEVLDMEKIIVAHNDSPKNFTVLHLVEENMPIAIRKISQTLGNSSQPMQAYWTSDVGGGWGMKKRNAVLITGGGTVASEKLLSTLFPDHKNISVQCSVSGTSAVKVMECSDVELVKELLEANVNPHILPDTTIKVRPAMLMLQPDKDDHMKEIDANRFEDNEELRYSLRSLEKHAPWVRRVFIVTSGQIPYWINLDHPKLKIIQHEDIFLNKSHLPTYSSPAIESHIHRIPGLSEHFLYLNDDVMLGSEVWPEDFYSPATGYKVYLSWSLPECSSGCPGSWLNDGYCDRSCNTSACEWDGGDCARDKDENSMFDGEEEFGPDMALDFCAPSCSDLWIADKYCDHSCNVRACGYDGGDCGLDDVKHLHEIPVPTESELTHTLPKGVYVAWMNISTLAKGGKAMTGQHTELDGLRSINVNIAQGILFLLLKNNITATLRIELEVIDKVRDNHGPKPNMSRKFNITLKCDTSPSEEVVTKAVKVSSSSRPAFVRNFVFDHVSPEYIDKDHPDIDDTELQKYSLVNLNASKLPQEVADQVLFYELLYKSDEITLNLLKKRKSLLIKNYVEGNPNHKLIYYSASEWPPEFEKAVSSIRESLYKNASEKILTNLVNLKSNSTSKNTKNFTTRGLLWDKKKMNDIYEESVIGENKVNYIKPAKDNQQIKYVNKRKYIDNGTLAAHHGNLPWERQQLFAQDNNLNPATSSGDYLVFHGSGRRLLDMFAESLLHVNRLYNSEFGYEARRVPAHMPHLINKQIMEDLQSRFQEEYELTSSHKIRQANDMQYAFSYFFYLMSKKRLRTTEEIFASFDTDNSGTLSDREIRTLLTRLYDLPLHYSTVQAFHYFVKNCSATHHIKPVPTPVYERYSDSDIPTVSLELILLCEPLRNLLNKLEKVSKYRYTQLSDDSVQFKMITSNVSVVVHMLDEVRKHPKKFVCLNSNLDPKSKDNELIHALVQDTYESLFPVPSTFELPMNYRNRFLYVKELQSWRRWRNFIRALIYACLASLIFLTVINFFSAELENLRRRWCRRRRRRDGFAGVRV
ncbi:N-acetylglucosamine-1-phosphotransferase subunits alpha/beta [Macrobrachium rosenbergii]|uniref:N-acetylglucosamine-1-phosphotransferase subunits alpha/beta n=1 Tax=Macrobrachium rosenbergii TaxID=79674 RepID=UPI0034D456C1